MPETHPLRVRLVHETNPRKYYPALFDLAESGDIQLTGVHRYSVFKEWLRSALKDRTPLIPRTLNALGDLRFRLTLPFVSGETVVLGFAPWDFRMLVYGTLCRRNHVIYHTSWPDWHLRATPRQAGRLTGFLQRMWLRTLRRPTVRTVAVIDAVAHSFTQETGEPAQVIPHAVPMVFFEAGSGRRARSDNLLRLVFVGEVSEKKGVTKLLALMERLSEQPVQLTIIGTGPLSDRLSSPPANVTYLGPIYDRRQLAQILAEHDVMIMLSQRTPTWEELFGISLVEGVAAGLAIIASDHVGPRTILGEGDRGLFNQDDLAGVHDMVQKMIIDRGELEVLRAAQAGAADRFHISHVRKLWLKAIKSEKIEPQA